MRLIQITPIQKIRIPSIPKNFASTPPSAGQTRKAVQKAAHISPIFFARFSLVDISDI
jgi:hypothetical protein